jgi:hypothetical protein
MEKGVSLYIYIYIYAFGLELWSLNIKKSIGLYLYSINFALHFDAIN